MPAQELPIQGHPTRGLGPPETFGDPFRFGAVVCAVAEKG